MSTTNQDKIKQFLARSIAAKLGAITFRLAHSTGRRGGVPVAEHPLEPGEGVELAELAKTLHDAAKHDAEAHGGPQTYRLTVHRQGDEDSPAPFALTLRVDGGEGGELGGDMDGSRAAALLARQLDATQRLLVTVWQSSLSSLEKENARLAAQNEKLQDRHIQFIELFEVLMSAQKERELEAMKATKAEERKDAALSKLAPLLPVLVNRLAGRTVLPDNSAAAALKTFAESLKPAQLDALLGTLTPEQFALFESVWKRTEEEDKK